jgi:hypothetical protein
VLLSKRTESMFVAEEAAKLEGEQISG